VEKHFVTRQRDVEKDERAPLGTSTSSPRAKFNFRTLRAFHFNHHQHWHPRILRPCLAGYRTTGGKRNLCLHSRSSDTFLQDCFSGGSWKVNSQSHLCLAGYRTTTGGSLKLYRNLTQDGRLSSVAFYAILLTRNSCYVLMSLSNNGNSSSSHGDHEPP
jgi:hypothetical protein